MNQEISLQTLRRLPGYYNILCQALESEEKYITSSAIAKMLNIDDTQVRKDIAATKYTGKPKIGFEVKELKAHLKDFLDLKTSKKVYLIGAGNLGVALAKYRRFEDYGLDIVAIFDNDPHKIGLQIGGKEVFPIFSLSEFIIDSNTNIDTEIAIVAVPAQSAQEVTNLVVRAGIKTIWNFAPINLNVPNDVLVWNQDLAASFVTLSLYSQRRTNSSKKLIQAE